MRIVKNIIFLPGFIIILLLFSSTRSFAQWIQTNGPFGGTVNCFILQSDSLGGTNIFAGTYGGVYLSTNNCSNWTNVSQGLTNSQVYALSFSGKNLFAGTSGGGVFLSTNNGNSWAPVNNGLPFNTSVYSFAISGTNVFAGSGTGTVYLSSNNGAKWTNVSSGLIAHYIQSLSVINSILFATTYDSGAFRSTNNGKSWSAINTGLSCKIIWSLAVRSDTLFAGTDNGLFVSTNYGTNWSLLGLSNINVYSIAFSAFGILAGSDNHGIFLSTNNGKVWMQINSGLPPDFVVFTLAAMDGFHV